MYRLRSVISVAALLIVTGCSAGSGKELLETARFEEKQHNREHALRLYEEVVRKYPGSEYAIEAQERLNRLRTGK
jgi:TolA-binding protein